MAATDRLIIDLTLQPHSRFLHGLFLRRGVLLAIDRLIHHLVDVRRISLSRRLLAHLGGCHRGAADGRGGDDCTKDVGLAPCVAL